MDKIQVKNMLKVLDRISQEIDILGNSLFNPALKPAPVKVKKINKFGR